MFLSDFDTPERNKLPRFYGVAYYDITRLGCWCYPIPLNLLIRWGHWLYFALAARSDSRWDRELRATYKHGYSHGYSQGFHDGVRRAEVLEAHEEKK